jgi:precorrin-4/cobalt-precorrin-4 C11-methyltransferase
MVFFIGAGPGDPELITVKGKKLLSRADTVIYAGSLVNRELLDCCKEGCDIYDSAGMNLEEVISVIKEAHTNNKTVVRLHTGDPSIYGTVKEQMDILGELGIKYEIVPGVSSFFAAAAALKSEYTLPGVSQTVIITRMEGRTEVPDKEDMELLAKHRASMVIFLSIHMIDKLVEKLKTSYPEDTGAAVVYKASWPEQKVIRGTLANIAELTKAEGIRKTALIVVGDFLGSDYELSKLYDRNFSHEFRGAAE